MKYLFLFFLAGGLWACANNDAQGNTAGSAEDRARQDSIGRTALNDSANFTTVEWIDSVNQNIGNVTDGSTPEITWRVKNTGDKPLIIADVTAGCGCTVAEKPGEPIAPGGTGTIKARYNTNGQGEGEHTKSVTVRANTKQLAYYLNFTANVVKK